MRKFILTTVIALFVVSVWLYAQEKDTAQGEPKVKLEIIYKKELGELMAGPEGFPPPEIRQILEDKEIPQEDKDWLLNSLRIEIARREKVLYINDGKAIKLPDDLQSITTSQNLKYMIVYAAHTDYGGMTADEVKKLRDEWLDAYKRYSQWQTKWERETEKKIPEYRDSMHYWLRISDSLNDFIWKIERAKKEYKKFICMETESGKVLWEKENMDHHINISNDGKTIITVPGGFMLNTTVFFYDAHGNEIKKVDGFYTPRGSFGMSADGELFAIVTRKNREDSLTMWIKAYDRKGNLLWQTEVIGNGTAANPCFAVSPNHAYVIASLTGVHWWREDYTYLLNNRGEIITKYDVCVEIPAFSMDGKYLILMSNKDTLYFIEAKGGGLLWKRTLGKHGRKTAMMPKDGEVIFIYSDIYERSPAYLLDSNGNIVWQTPGKLENAVGLSPNGFFFIPSAKPDVIIYHISSEVSNENK
ncbi:MAG: WD40 repeat domain-containing protein [candidate division WOR-3 bacterium]